MFDLSSCAEEFLEDGIITHERMRAVDANAQALGVTGLPLMESAGKALAASVLALRPKVVLILCGRGNNGGDGMVGPGTSSAGWTPRSGILITARVPFLCSPACGTQRLPGDAPPVCIH